MKVNRELDVAGFQEYVASIRACGEHPLVTLTDDVLASVESVIETYIEEAESYEDTEGFVLVKLPDGYGLLFEWSDSSGHG